MSCDIQASSSLHLHLAKYKKVHFNTHNSSISAPKSETSISYLQNAIPPSYVYHGVPVLLYRCSPAASVVLSIHQIILRGFHNCPFGACAILASANGSQAWRGSKGFRSLVSALSQSQKSTVLRFVQSSCYGWRTVAVVKWQVVGLWCSCSCQG